MLMLVEVQETNSLFKLFLWAVGWVGVENEINAISAFNWVGVEVEVEVEAELGKNQWIFECLHIYQLVIWISGATNYV